MLYLVSDSVMYPGCVECPGEVDVDEPVDVIDLVATGSGQVIDLEAGDLVATAPGQVIDLDAGDLVATAPGHAVDLVATAPSHASGGSESDSGGASNDLVQIWNARWSLSAPIAASGDLVATAASGDWPKRCPGKKLMLEMFSPPRMVPIFCSFGGSGLSLDLKTGWDASTWDDRSKLLRWHSDEKPDVIIGCPPCTMYSQLQHTNKRKMGQDKFDQKLKAAHVLIDFQMSVFKSQVETGHGFIFEHPAGASSWSRPSVRSVAQLPGVLIVNIDQCRYGLTDLEGNLLKKPTRLMFNLGSCAREFSDKRCNCTQPHGQCQGQQRGRSVATHAQVYPPALANAFARCAWEHVNDC